MENNFEHIALSIHRVEVTQYRNGLEKEKKVETFNNEQLAKQSFDGLSTKEFRHLLLAWSFCKKIAYTKIELFQNDVLTDRIIINIGVEL